MLVNINIGIHIESLLKVFFCVAQIWSKSENVWVSEIWGGGMKNNSAILRTLGVDASRVLEIVSTPRSVVRPADSKLIIWTQAVKRGEDISTRASGSDLLRNDTIEAYIVEAPDIACFVQSARCPGPLTTAWNHLHGMGLVVKHFRFILHTLFADQEREFTRLPINLTSMTEPAKQQG
jgi:hypothetical protein